LPEAIDARVVSFTYHFDDARPEDWPVFLARIERAVDAGDVAANGSAAYTQQARRRVEQERAEERLAWAQSEQARIDAAKARPARRERWWNSL
jgi:hypothetical protein